MNGFVEYYMVKLDEVELALLKMMKKDDPESSEYDELIALKEHDFE